MSLPADITDEQRDQLLRASAGLTAAVQAYIAAMLPVAQAWTAQLRKLSAALQAAGLLDERGWPVHLGEGENAEDCIACRGTNPPYPFLCPGNAEPEEPRP
ncbi:hypothetical protein [Streptomyces sp. NPDC056387]|uniref:hypothetical protein n=1 Tax=Streptomyces sp. NPDC056387 TaxID=3345803 RepID=UPI0035E04EF7